MTKTDTSNLTLGTLDEAEDALLMFTYNMMLDGWRRLGQGIHRCAYLSPSGTVYKVPTPDYGHEAHDASRKEFEAVQTLSAIPAPEGFGVPKAGIVEVLDMPILSMEFIEGQPEYLDGVNARTAAAFYRNNDIHAGNVVRRQSDGLIYMIDLGFFENGEGDSDGICREDCCRICSMCDDACGGGCEDNCGNCLNHFQECICCHLCNLPRDGWNCDCCMDCEEVADNCCCSFCPECTMHIDDCRGECAAGDGPM